MTLPARLYMRPNNNAHPDKAIVLLLAKALILKIGLSALHYTYDDTGLVVHVKIQVKRVKRSTQFTGPISIYLEQQLPSVFLEVIEVRLPEGTSNLPMLSGKALVKDKMYVWTLEPITSSLIVRLVNGTIKLP